MIAAPFCFETVGGKQGNELQREKIQHGHRSSLRTQRGSDRTTYRHGYFWVKCSQKTITVHIPFLTEDMVRHSVNKLVEKGIIKVGVFSDDKFDHTYYYTFTQYGNELLDDSRCFD